MSRKKSGARTRQGRPTISAEGRFVSLYCRGTVPAPHDKWRVAAFYPDTHDGELFWSEIRGWYASTGARHLEPISSPVTRWLDGDRYIARDRATLHVEDERDVDAPYRESFRTVWELECRACRFKRTIKPADAYPLLSTLSVPGVIELPLRAFTARVGKTG